jgi:hypothetical protein
MLEGFSGSFLKMTVAVCERIKNRKSIGPCTTQTLPLLSSQTLSTWFPQMLFLFFHHADNE